MAVSYKKNQYKKKFSNRLLYYQNKQQKAPDYKKLCQQKDSEKNKELLLSSFVFITPVFYLEFICIMKPRNNFQ